MHIKLGEIIKDAREYKEITGGELAEYVGVSEEQDEEIEENHIVPDFDTVLLICHFLDIEVDWGWLKLITEIANF
jgi:transcriptional regulator with XRE-family HTH domain